MFYIREIWAAIYSKEEAQDIFDDSARDYCTLNPTDLSCLTGAYAEATSYVVYEAVVRRARDGFRLHPSYDLTGVGNNSGCRPQ